MLKEVYKSKRGPKALLEHFFENVSLFEGFVVVFISFLLNILLLFFLKTPNFTTSAVYSLYSSVLINWLLLGIVLYLVLRFIRGTKKLPKNAFQKMLSSLSAFRVPSIIFFVIFFVIFMIFLSAFISPLQTIIQDPSLATSTTLFPEFSVFNIIGVVLIGVLSLFYIGYILAMLYEFSEIMFGVKKPFTKILTVILIALLLSFLSSIFL